MRSVWLIAVFPFSFFLTAVYADALYFCLCAWSLAFAYGKRWPLACALAAMAAMTRIPGIALFPALALEYLRQNPPSPKGFGATGRVASVKKAAGLRGDPRDCADRDRHLLRLALRRSARPSCTPGRWDGTAPPVSPR